MAKEREESEGLEAPDWIVTFADMISLLVTFFILLMTFSSLDTFDAFQAKKNLLAKTGVLTSGVGESAVDPPDVDIMMAKDAVRGSQIPHARPAAELLDNLEEMGQKKTDEHSEVDLNSIEDGLLIRFDDRSTFGPGSTELTEHLESAVGELARVLENYPYTVVIQGHTDDHFRRTQLYPDATALSAARAEAVAAEMVRASKISPLQIQTAGLGDSVPLENNETADGRRSNRRIEIRIVSLSQERAAAARPAPQEAVFNG